MKEAYKDYIYPTIRYADLIVPGSRNNKVSVDFIVRHMKNITREMYRLSLLQSILQEGDQHQNLLLRGGAGKLLKGLIRRGRPPDRS